jgi:hypothetical protein
MPTQDQLEIISPSRETEFHDLDPDKGITNIGRHPENDVVIDIPGVALFHTVLDHQQKPYQLMLLSQGGETTLGGQPLPTNVSVDFHSWDTLEIGGYTIVLLEGTSVAALPPTPPVVPKPGAPPPKPETATKAVVPQQPPRPAIIYPDRSDDVIVTQISAREWAVDVDQTATCQLTVINGGDIVATFEMKVKGLDEDWVSIAPPEVNLNEGDRATVTIAITPPRLPTSRAGAHGLAVVVTSPNHPNRSSQIGATLVINPYYEFAVGELSPKKQKVSWRKRSGESSISIMNRGNSLAAFRLEGKDEERACSFEFLLRDGEEEIALARQADVPVPPGETATVPMRITPLSRRLAGLRGHTYSLTLTTTMVEGELTPRSLLGQLISKPLLGPLHIALIVLLVVGLAVFATWPRIYDFRADSGVVEFGEEVTLSWRVSPFATDLQIEGVEESVSGSAGEIAVSPQGPAVTYKLLAGNLLSRLIPISKENSREQTVIVRPLPPVINTFSVDKKDAASGESVTANWSVSYAEKLTFRAGDFVKEIPPEEHVGQIVVSPNSDTLISLEARNASDVALASAMIWVYPPEIQFFDVQPSEITAGESVMITWDVVGVESVSIRPNVQENAPLSGTIEHAPSETTIYELVLPDGKIVQKKVKVNPAPTPMPEPQAPVIEFFTAAPNEVTSGGDDEVQLAWSILGDTTNVEISSLDSYNGSNLKTQDIITVNISQTTLFILTAFNGDLNASQTVEVKLLESTPSPSPTPSPTPAATPVPLNIVFFQAENGTGTSSSDVVQVSSSDNTIRYRVVAGSAVKFSWNVENATAVTFVGFGEQPFPEGNLTTVISEPRAEPYQLTATGQDGTTEASAFIQIELQAASPPPAPFGVNGTSITSTNTVTNTLTWKYNADSENDIVGFRIYRTDVTPETGFVRIVGEDNLGSGVRQWVDILNSPCYRAGYYVVAIYTDTTTGDTKETNASTTSWYGETCP